jgi:hypothetical protein
MSACLLLTGFGFFIQNANARIAVVATGIYLFEVAYSPGEGPVPVRLDILASGTFVRRLLTASHL